MRTPVDSNICFGDVAHFTALSALACYMYEAMERCRFCLQALVGIPESENWFYEVTSISVLEVEREEMFATTAAGTHDGRGTDGTDRLKGRGIIE